VAVEGIRELARVLGTGNRRRRCLDRRAAGTLEREPRGAGCGGDPEAVQHLGGQRVVRSHPEDVRRVVVRDERVDELEHPLDRSSIHCDEPVTDEGLVAGVDDEDAVREAVQPYRIEVQRAHVSRVAGEEAGVAVAWPEGSDDPQDPDEQLVTRDRRGAYGELVHLGPKAGLRDAPEGRRVDLLDRRAQIADVVGECHLGGGSGLRR
jgi:hypothetical protein